jgi:hypothetical protein
MAKSKKNVENFVENVNYYFFIHWNEFWLNVKS